MALVLPTDETQSLYRHFLVAQSAESLDVASESVLDIRQLMEGMGRAAVEAASVLATTSTVQKNAALAACAAALRSNAADVDRIQARRICIQQVSSAADFPPENHEIALGRRASQRRCS